MGQNNEMFQGANEQISYITLEGGADEIENFEATIAVQKKIVERAEIVEKMIADGTFYKLFDIQSRREEIALATSHLINPMMKDKMVDTLIFHSHLDTYFGRLVAEGQLAKATIESLEAAIADKMHN